VTTVAPARLEPAAARAGQERIRLREAAESFEALMVQTLLKSMSEAQLENGFFGEGPGASTYQGVFEEQLAERLSQGSPFGIARMLEEEWAGRIDPQGEVKDALQKVADVRAREAYGEAAAAAGGASAAPSRRAAPVQEAPVSPGAPRESAGPAKAVPRPARPGSASVSSPFGWRKDPFNGEVRFHQGVDLPAPTGTPVVSVAPGEVASVRRSPGYGLQVVVRHGMGWMTRYAHLSGVGVAEGQKVGRGEILGEVGSSGRSTGPHLHFEAAREGQEVDPANAAPGPLRAQVLGK
jgi:murein DD-endopeptidase MepM/ murein hydrolase activator NlpD